MLRSLSILCIACASCTLGASPPGPAVGGFDSQPVPWSVSRHVFPNDPRPQLTRDLELVAQLGASYVRTDLWWYAVEPAPGAFDQAVLDGYRWYVEEAQRHGLGVIAILSNAPDWARTLSRDELAQAFEAYSERVAEMIGDRVTYYQLWNEPNNVTDAPDSDTDAALLRAGRRGVERGRMAIGASASPLRTVVNVLVDGHDAPIGPRWEDDVRYYLSHGARDAIDVIAIDHYPGTWSIGDWGGNILDRLFALGREQGKAVAIFEAGYATSSCSLPLNTEANQARWIHEQVPRIAAKIRDHAAFELVNWFKLDDRNTGECFDPEDNFGLVRTDRSQKPAFDALAFEIARFGDR